jgi:hypothetical protein
MVENKDFRLHKARTMWPRVQDMVAWGLQQNALKVLKVP